MRTMTLLPILFFSALAVAEEKGSVEVPLSTWERMVDAVDAGKQTGRADQAYCPMGRTIEGVFHRGIFRGVLTARFMVLDSGHVQVPVIDASASLGIVTLNAKRTSLYREDPLFTVGVEKPGAYVIRAEIIWGKEVDRFDRKLAFLLPEAGSTKISIEIPERDIEATLQNGALTSSSEQGAATRLEGYLDASGKFDLTWNRRLSHAVRGPVASEVKLYSLFTVQEALVTGQSLFKMNILEGEADRIDLRLPRDIEIIDVSGDAVLQWRTDPKDGGRLIVLFRHLVQDQVAMTVRFQYPIKEGNEVALVMPLADTSAAMTGVVGILSTSGLNVRITRADSAAEMELRDLPPDLTDMTSNPFLYGLSFNAPPAIRLSVTRHKEVALTETLIDDLQASTVIIQDGLEITKMKLRIRNNNRQYLKMELPAGTRLTHSMIDGMPVRPALVKTDNRDVLLFPLHQSESVNAAAVRYHLVRSGETLSDIANRYYSDPDMWRFILKNNDNLLRNADDLMEGQKLRILPRHGVTIRESSFLIELAYQRKSNKPLGWIGSRSFTLPKVDLETVQAAWHLYIPQMLDAISFRSNMTQLTAVRYGPFTRFRDFVRDAFLKKAWAGGGPEYSNILVQRKAIYKADYAKRSREETVLSSFPLVGQKYRFSRSIMGSEPPRISLFYMPRWISGSIAWLGFVAAFGAVFLIIARRKDRRTLALAGLGFIALLVLAHFFLGMHRKIIWGVDAALFISILRMKLPSLRARTLSLVKEPWTLAKIVTWGNILIMAALSILIGIVLALPMFFSSWLLILLVIWRWRQGRLDRGLPPRAAGTAAGIMLLFLFIFTAPGYSQSQFSSRQADIFSEEQQSQNAADAWQDEPVVTENNNQSEQAKEAESDRNFDEIMKNQDKQMQQQAPVLPPLGSIANPEKQPFVKINLDDYNLLRKRVREIAARNSAPKGPAVILGASDYSGKTVHGSLSLRLKLQVTLGYPGTWKTVPLAGDDAILVSASVMGQPIPVFRRNKYHIWITDRAGEIEIEANILVPARGPRGSIEYDFRTVRTPSTTFACEFPLEGLEPQLSAALRAESKKMPGGTAFSATLRTTSRIHLIGFKDMGESDGQPAKVYAETRSLLSIDKDAMEMFSVFYYTILYSGTQKFNILIPRDSKVVSVDARGAFRYNLEPADSGVLLSGETEFPIRNNFEISLRLRRELKKNGEVFAAPLPRCRGVERESGWLGVEVPGKLQLEEKDVTSALPIDMRQLPDELLRSAVSPVLRAYQYHSPAARVNLFASSLPEIEPASGSIDNIQAITQITDKGDILTDMRLTLRNRLRHNITMKLPRGADAVSAMIDEQPLNISRDEKGQILVPLKRSEGDDRLRPFTVSLTLKKNIRKLAWLGLPSLELPSVDMPVSSMTWHVFVPGFHTYSKLRGDIDPQRYAGQAEWQQPPDEPDLNAAPAHQASYENAAFNPSPISAGGMPVQVKIPLSGKELVYMRYWIEQDKPVKVFFAFVRSSLLIPVRFFLVLLTGAALFLLLNGRRSRTSLGMAAAALLVMLPAGYWLGRAILPSIGLLAGIAAVGLYRRWHIAVAGWVKKIPADFRDRRNKEKKLPIKIRLKRAARYIAFTAMGLIFAATVNSLVHFLLRHPL
jgi:hypothetical protein